MQLLLHSALEVQSEAETVTCTARPWVAHSNAVAISIPQRQNTLQHPGLQRSKLKNRLASQQQS